MFFSDFYNIVNEQGDPLSTLSLHDLKEKYILPIYGIPSLVLSLALSVYISIFYYLFILWDFKFKYNLFFLLFNRQEEVDIYFCENM